MDARAANDRIAEKAEQLRFVSRVPMLCECSTPACRAIVMISLEEYRRVREDSGGCLTARGHTIDGTELVKETDEYAIRLLRCEGNGDRRSA
ncbi:MAG TPA: hypothetical protein VIR14_03380 [Gaiellaceae bacterium]|jgi:hypothetical protein